MEKVSLTAGAVCNGCLVYEQQDQNVVVLIDTPSWYAWLETATTFTCDEGVFTAHKAPAGNRRGGWYWRAYRRRRGRLSRCYLGVSTNLTLANLRGAARRLAGDAEDMESLQADEGTPPPVPVPLASGELTSTVILQSTTTPPRLPVQHVARPRLLALLGSVMEHVFGATSLPLFVVCPPAVDAEQASARQTAQNAKLSQGPVGLL
jgi:LuxR family transcriptional regulator, maltose regulon positive regulatory protein